ncbi:M1 family metallopeptidase [Pelomonas sp. SE-A7]|uniref:M1 family metallopeptidase n=1 Tax=Pelomonas sp. SE-A7 TaxID=3054953 RepID=UPI00259D26F7|nr:M1 family metallopeptidase [Pelomonas sp. SE-A7]MDM4765832.1 M1 family metallopeptidase [Pelomonas sp. SE-A7]
MKKLLALLLSAAPLIHALAATLDPQSYARFDQVRVQSLHLDLKADFGRKTLAGYAELKLQWADPAARVLDLDTSELSIAKVQAQDAKKSWIDLPFQLDPLETGKGRALHIDLQGLAAQPTAVRIHYATAPTASALQWLTPAQTVSGKQPFMFSQSQSIHARSWVPLQDTPAVRFTYSARIEAPQGLRVVMSADNRPDVNGEDGWTFQMPQPIPSYLLAIAIGELQFQALGPRSGVYAEPQRLKAAAHEFADTEQMITAAESLYGPYRWGRYDMLLLPPSFPYGGMENPRLTFLTPTMIAGDRSLVDLIAHELAHSWSGNLVTNASFKHGWLNEGFTTYVTTRIVEALYGPEFAAMHLQLEEEEALESLKRIALPKQALITRDPDTSAAFHTNGGLAYPKGAWFLRTLEQRAGRALFDPFLRGWFDKHAFQSVTTQQFKDYLQGQLLAAHPEVMSPAELEDWLHGPGIPASARRSQSPRLSALNRQREAWLAGKLASSDLKAGTWQANEWMKFLNDIDGQASADQLKELDQAYKLAGTGNQEIAFRFYRSAIKAGYELREPMRQFMSSVGRIRMISPLYEAALFRSPADRDWALAVYAQAKPRYHPLTQRSIERLIARAQEPATASAASR